ncbi:NACHT domain-containing protein [Leptolyngbya sp. KIOST-1]|uniref:NACHT domain-containing protein n=1 Tax=Leptolyngbya sp. KIOST-1 TaxID=1229172 RepID=UPI00056774FE|nr:NACHT domain-containing NTPase [Leptolyngbya sp. KIOST-1]
MAGRSLTATPDGIQQINRALTKQGWSRDDLAKECDCSRQPAVKFCSGKAVSNKLFVSFCNVLELDWEAISGQKPASGPDETPEPETDIDALVQIIRAKVHDDIQERCGKMRVLDMEQPIGLGDIYTSVNILEKLSGRRRLGLNELMKDCDPENFDRFLLGQVRHERVPGLEAVERYNQLMILGKPGAGKTTFMKRLAILCNQGEFQPERVPIFVTLKEYAEAEGKPTLQIHIQRQWNACGVEAVDALSAVLRSGKALVLLDGLDEVNETDHGRVLQDIKTFAHHFRNCQCVITCRIAAKEYTFEQFTEVEVADFDQKQIAEFSTKWFAVKQDPKKAETFIQRLEINEPIQELATNPLLLTLLCLVFGEAADFPANRAELYKEGLDVLLKKWDGKRNIERDQVYKKLSLKRKEDLLSQIAFETFERGDYFFRQATVEQYIIGYIFNLPGASDDEEALQLDSEAVLKSIEAQHGLLVERARTIYSFSHLTFQEYFTAQHIISPTAALNQTLQNLATHITEKRYREIFLLTVGMLSQADSLLLLMKQQIDWIMINESTGEQDLQAILIWGDQKAHSANAFCNTAAIRAFYYTLSLNLNCDRNLPLHQALDLDISLDLDLNFNLILDLIFEPNYAPNGSFYLILDLALDTARTRVYALRIAEQVIRNLSSNLKFEVQELSAALPIQVDWEIFNQWWSKNGGAWSEKLKMVMIEHRNIGHDWRLSGAQKEKAQQYYDANKLLVDCLNSDCYVTKATRQYIEDTLLLPLSEIEKYPVPDAIANL